MNTYNKVIWQNDPSTNTPLSEANLNHMDDAIAENRDHLIALDLRTAGIVKGEKGDPGSDGTNATLQIGEVETLPSGTNAYVENVGTDTTAILNFGIPKGIDGTGAGTITGVKMNGEVKGTSGVVDLGNVLTDLPAVFGKVVASDRNYAEVYLWSDGNPSQEDRLGRFVTLGANGISIASSDSATIGVSVQKSDVGFIGGYADGDENDSSKAIVSIIGVAHVKTNDNSIVANDFVMSDANGYAVKASYGYRVIKVVSSGLLEISVSPNTDAIQRTKADMGGLKFVSLTQSEYDSLASKDANTIYLVGE